MNRTVIKALSARDEDRTIDPPQLPSLSFRNKNISAKKEGYVISFTLAMRSKSMCGAKLIPSPHLSCYLSWRRQSQEERGRNSPPPAESGPHLALPNRQSNSTTLKAQFHIWDVKVLIWFNGRAPLLSSCPSIDFGGLTTSSGSFDQCKS